MVMVGHHGGPRGGGGGGRARGRGVPGVLRAVRAGAAGGGAAGAGAGSGPGPAGLRRALDGDTVEAHYRLVTQAEGHELDSSYGQDPLTFQIGAGEVAGNTLFQGFDQALKGLGVGEKAEIEVEGQPWDPELLFEVPIGHEEVTRLEGRYKNQGGIVVGNIVELRNGQQAFVLEKTDEFVKLDANSMFAGSKLLIELELINIETLD